MLIHFATSMDILDRSVYLAHLNTYELYLYHRQLTISSHGVLIFLARITITCHGSIVLIYLDEQRVNMLAGQQLYPFFTLYLQEDFNEEEMVLYHLDSYLLNRMF